MKKFYNRDDIPGNFTGECYVESTESTMWFLNGKIHKEDGPAVESTGTKIWMFHGAFHRLDGPARCYGLNVIGSATIQYWIYDQILSEENYWNDPRVVDYKLNKILNAKI